jgi:hypothetical protein
MAFVVEGCQGRLWDWWVGTLGQVVPEEQKGLLEFHVCHTIALCMLFNSAAFYSFVLCFETGFYYVAQAGLKLMILLPQPLSAGSMGLCHHLVFNCFLKTYR